MTKYTELETDIRKVIPQDILNNPHFIYNPDGSGYRNFVFGCMAGPSRCIDNLLHEICHAVEFGHANYRQRMAGGIFHFKKPKSQYLGYPFNTIVYDPPKGNHASMRELETFAMQYLILEQSGIERSIEKYIDVLQYVPDYMNYDVQYGEKEKQFLKFKEKWTVEQIWNDFRIILSKIKRSKQRRKQ